ncbi:hypothetical protein BH18CHL2_BH18CHL2_11670 [soil metagenome]
MLTLTRTFRRVLGRRDAAPSADASAARRTAPANRRASESVPINIGANDPLLAYFHTATGAVAVDELTLDSPAVRALREAGVQMVVPLISQGEVIGLLSLGPRLSEQGYGADERQLLEKLAAQTAPAVRVAQLVREQEVEVRARERMQQELHVAQLIQQHFLPKKLPELPGWQVAAFYRAAREVGGDFYDFIELPGGHVAVVVGDVTGKGVPAALVMATTRSILRSEAGRLLSPAKILARANDILHADIPSNMFVTCLVAVLEPLTGRIPFAKAGHDLPYVRTDRGVIELRATGMPLGLMPGIVYDEKEAMIGAGESILLHSDGVAEAHDPERRMFGFPRGEEIVAQFPGGHELIDGLLSALHVFAGEGWQQEDDITLVTLSRSALMTEGSLVSEFEVPSEPGNERRVMDLVAQTVSELNLEPARLARLKTAVAEAAMNAIEHGNQNRPELPVRVYVSVADDRLSVRITDFGGDTEIPEPETPDLEAKLAGVQRPRGWGLFLIKNMVDEMHTSVNGQEHSVELVLSVKGAGDDSGA